MSKKLLLADDSITIQKVIGITFANEDYDLTVVGDGDTALEKACTERPDLILADVFMPGRNGYELCAAVKQDPSLKGVPVLLLTGTFEPFDEGKAAASGADSWIAKPFESQALIDRVEELLSRVVQSLPAELSPETVVPTAAQLPAEEEDIWADLPGFATPDEGGEPAGIEEAFAPTTGIAEEGGSTLSFPRPENDIWQSLGEELPAENEAADPFAFADAEEELSAGDVVDSFAEEPATAAEDFFVPKEESEASLGLDHPFIEEDAEEEEEWIAAAAESAKGEVPADDAVWDAFEDEEILALDESDILEEEFEIPEDENLASIVASMEGEEEGPPIDIEETEDELPPAEMVWDSDLEATDAEDEEFPTMVRESFVTGAAGDFMAAEAGADEDVFALDADDLTEEVEISAGAMEESFGAEADYAFSLEEASAPSPALPRPPEEPLSPPVPAEPARSVPAAAVEEKVSALTDAEIERIVEKVAGSVIERLAQTMLERIAWEVVPDLAESMIKEEIRKIREEVQ